MTSPPPLESTGRRPSSILAAFLSAWIAGSAGGGTARGEVVHLPAVKDTSVFSEGVLSGGAGAHLFAGRSGPNASGALRRTLLKFDVAAAIPAGAQVQSATLHLTVDNTPITFTPTAMKWHRLGKDWGEGTAEPGGGGGAPASPGDATWLANRLGSELWSASGGDFAAAPSAVATVGGDGPVAWTSPGLAGDVQNFLDQPATNFGWILVGDEAVSRSARRFTSRDGSTGQPRLTVEYSTSPPTNREAWIAMFYDPAEVVVDTDDLDGDGLDTLFEYAAGLDPKTANARAESCSIVLAAGPAGVSLQGHFIRDPRATDLGYRIEASHDLLVWFPLAESLAGAAANGMGVVSDLPLSSRPPFRRVEFDDGGAFDGQGLAFVRCVVDPN